MSYNFCPYIHFSCLSIVKAFQNIGKNEWQSKTSVLGEARELNGKRTGFCSTSDTCLTPVPGRAGSLALFIDGNLTTLEFYQSAITQSEAEAQQAPSDSSETIN